MDKATTRRRTRANGIAFPAAEPEFRAARQRCAEACAKYNAQAESASPEKRARLWQSIVAQQAQQPPPYSAAHGLGIEKQSTGHKLPSDEASVEATKSVQADGSTAGEPDFSHSPSAVSQETASTQGRAGETPPPSPGTKANASSPHPIDESTISVTPPPSRKASRNPLVNSSGEVTQDSTDGPELEHDPAITNPFIVAAPYVKPPCYIDYGVTLQVGKGTFINRNFVVIDSPILPIKIGERCLLGPSVTLAAVEHPLDADERKSPIGAPSLASSIEIGDECWIAADVKILCGVKIGAGCVIGAGSVVTKDIPDGCLAYGNPARVVRIVSPKFWARAMGRSKSTDVFDSALSQPTGEMPAMLGQSISHHTPAAMCVNGCSAVREGGSKHLAHSKDIMLLCLSIASLGHLLLKYW